MKQYALLCTLLIAGHTSIGMEQQKTAPEQKKSQYTITDLNKAISDKNPAKVSLILDDLAEQGIMTAEKYENAMNDISNFAEKLDKKLEKWDAPWWKRVALGCAAIGYGGYEIATTIETIKDKNTNKVITALQSSSSFPLALGSIGGGLFLIYNGWNKRVAAKKTNLLDVKLKLEQFKKNNPELVEKISPEEIKSSTEDSVELSKKKKSRNASQSPERKKKKKNKEVVITIEEKKEEEKK